jgi:hypothetical protein
MPVNWASHFLAFFDSLTIWYGLGTTNVLTALFRQLIMSIVHLLKERGMNKKKLAGITAGSAVAIIAAILSIHFGPWARTPPVETYTLTTVVSPSGAGSIFPSGGKYELGEEVTLTACPEFGYRFEGWSGDVSGNLTGITITMNHDYSVIANFVPAGLDIPKLIAPECGARNLRTRNVDFVWTVVDEADEYYFVLSTHCDLSPPIVEATAVNCTAHTCKATLAYDTVYYWQVKALRGGSVISESSIGVFRTPSPSETG